MEKVTLSKIEHKGETRIRVDFPYDVSTIQIIKQLSGSKWSQSKKCWHLPYVKGSYVLLQEHFDISYAPKENPIAVDAALKTKSNQAYNSPVQQQELPTPKDQLIIQVSPEHDFRVKVFVPWQQKDWIAKMKSLPDRAWNKDQKYWSIPKTMEVLLLLQKLFGEELKVDGRIAWDRNPSVTYIEPSKSAKQTVDKEKKKVIESPKLPIETISSAVFHTVQKAGQTLKTVVGQKIVIEQGNEQWLRAFVPYDKKGWIAVIKNIAGRKWDSSLKSWLIPNVKESYRLIKQEIGLDNVFFQFKIPVDIPEYFNSPKRVIKRKTKKSFLEQLPNIQRDALIQLDERLLLERLSPSTRKSYKHHLAGLFFYFKEIAPENISLEQVQQYLLYRIRNKKIAESTQNQIINAVKAY